MSMYLGMTEEDYLNVLKGTSKNKRFAVLLRT